MDVDIKRLSANIMRGDHDGELAQLVEAVRYRFANGPGVMRWALKHVGPEHTVEVTEDDLTLAEARAVEKATFRSWADVDPIASADCCCALMCVVLERRNGLSAEDAAAYVDSLPVSEVVDAITRYEVADGPFDSAAPETP